MRVYHFLNREYGLDNLKKRRLKVARIHELNDPFEFIGAELSTRDRRKALKATKEEIGETRGIICFSKKWNNPLMWSHYAQKHQGICLGFDVNKNMFEPVEYVGSKLQWPDSIDEEFIRKLIFTKFSHWQYENEWRACVDLQESENNLYFEYFSDELLLKEIIVGCNSIITRDEIANAISGIQGDIDIFKAREAFRSFNIVKNEKQSLWK